MTEFLLNYDRYGYCIGIDDVTDKTVTEVENIVAGYHNRQKGFIENLSGSWTIIKSDSLNALEEIQQQAAMSDCMVAWNNGNDHCQCGIPECPLAID